MHLSHLMRKSGVARFNIKVLIEMFIGHIQLQLFNPLEEPENIWLFDTCMEINIFVPRIYVYITGSEDTSSLPGILITWLHPSVRFIEYISTEYLLSS